MEKPGEEQEIEEKIRLFPFAPGQKYLKLADPPMYVAERDKFEKFKEKVLLKCSFFPFEGPQSNLYSVLVRGKSLQSGEKKHLRQLLQNMKFAFRLPLESVYKSRPGLYCHSQAH